MGEKTIGLHFGSNVRLVLVEKLWFCHVAHPEKDVVNSGHIDCQKSHVIYVEFYLHHYPNHEQLR